MAQLGALFHLRRFAADDRRSGAAATSVTVANELLDAFSGVDLGGVDIAFAVQADLMQPVEIAGHPARASETAELFETAAIEDVDGLVGVIADVQTALRVVLGEVH